LLVKFKNSNGKKKETKMRDVASVNKRVEMAKFDVVHL